MRPNPLVRDTQIPPWDCVESWSVFGSDIGNKFFTLPDTRIHLSQLGNVGYIIAEYVRVTLWCADAGCTVNPLYESTSAHFGAAQEEPVQHSLPQARYDKLSTPSSGSESGGRNLKQYDSSSESGATPSMQPQAAKRMEPQIILYITGPTIISLKSSSYKLMCMLLKQEHRLQSRHTQAWIRPTPHRKSTKQEKLLSIAQFPILQMKFIHLTPFTKTLLPEHTTQQTIRPSRLQQSLYHTMVCTRGPQQFITCTATVQNNAECSLLM